MFHGQTVRYGLLDQDLRSAPPSTTSVLGSLDQDLCSAPPSALFWNRICILTTLLESNLYFDQFEVSVSFLAPKCCGSRLRKGEVFAYVGSIQNLKDLKHQSVLSTEGRVVGLCWAN